MLIAGQLAGRLVILLPSFLKKLVLRDEEMWSWAKGTCLGLATPPQADEPSL